MPHRPILRSSARIAAERDRSGLVRHCIERLLSDPAVARRVQARLSGAPRPKQPCLVTLMSRRPCSAVGNCGRLDCLCGRYPRKLTEKDIRDGCVPERLVA